LFTDGAKKDIKSMFMMAVTTGKKYCIANGGVLYIFDKQSSKKQSESIILKGWQTFKLGSFSSDF